MTERRIYFAKPIGMDGPIKIGCSAFTETRLALLTVWSPWPLEIIGSVPGTFADERFLHEMFLETHSHLEWFFSSQDLRETIKRILEAGSVSAVRGGVVITGKFCKKIRKVRTEEWRQWNSFLHRVRIAERKLRSAGQRRCHAPEYVGKILRAWRKGPSPSPEDIQRLEEYLANPAEHSVASPYEVWPTRRSSSRNQNGKQVA